MIRVCNRKGTYLEAAMEDALCVVDSHVSSTTNGVGQVRYCGMISESPKDQDRMLLYPMAIQRRISTIYAVYKHVIHPFLPRPLQGHPSIASTRLQSIEQVALASFWIWCWWIHSCPCPDFAKVLDGCWYQLLSLLLLLLSRWV